MTSLAVLRYKKVVKSLSRNQKAEIQTLSNFLNDPAWMELYGYTAFTLDEVVKLHEHLVIVKKGNLHREALAKEALALFPQRARGRSGSVKKIYLTVSSVLILLVAAAGVVFLWN